MNSSFEKRGFFLTVLIFIVFFIILIRSFYLQVIRYSEMADMVEAKNYQLTNIHIHRGKILDQENQILAASLPSPSVYLLKNKTKSLEESLFQVSKILHLNLDKIQNKVENSDNYVWIDYNINKKQEQALKTAKIPGIYLAPDFIRYYPSLNHAAHVVGFTGLYSKGREGIEYKYNDVLMGQSKYSTSSDFSGIYSKDLRKTQGLNIYLSINKQIQYQTEKVLNRAVTSMNAISGVAIVMETKTGKVLAMANIPDYDPNRYQEYEVKNFYNRAVGDSYEPGSIFKIITIAIAREHNYISKEDKFFCENGYFQVLDHIIRDSTGKFGILSIGEIIQKSSNIGAIKIGQKIPRKNFFEEIIHFGFRNKTEVGMPGEQNGILKNFQLWSKSDLATISYGHSILVTPIQMVSAINAIANNGVYVTPSIVTKFTNESNEVVFSQKIQKRRILSKKVAKEMIEYMKGVVSKEGTGYLAKLDNMAVAGKTGTTRKYDRKLRRYSTENHIVSFAGLLPAEDPQLTILTIINEPEKPKNGSKSAAPVFREIAKTAFDIYNPTDIPTYVTKKTEVPKISSLFKKQEEQPIKLESWKGLSMRDALIRASELQKQLKIEGSGVVVQQKVNKNNTEVILKLK